MPFPHIENLLGTVSDPSDLKTFHSINRYMETTTLTPGQILRMKVPRIGPDYLLDCRNIRMKFTLTVTSSDAAICVAGIAFPFSTTRIQSGTTELLNIQNAGLLANLQYRATQDANISPFEQSENGDGTYTERKAWADAPKEYLINALWPENSVLRGDRLFDVNNSSDLLLEFTLMPAAQYLYSIANDTAATYSLSNIQILSTYICSPSLAGHFRSNPMKFTCQDYRNNYSLANDLTSQIRLASSCSSLNGFYMVLRDANVDAKFNVADKLTTYNGNALSTYQLLLNQIPFFQQPVDSMNQFFNELTHWEPKVRKVPFFTSLYSTTRFVIGVRVSASPEQYRDEITSGVRTSGLNNDMVMQLVFGSALATQQEVNTFLESDVCIWLSTQSKDVQIVM